MSLAKIEVNDYGGAPFATHNFPCAVCGERPAVLGMGNGVFGPCWGCKSKGWRTLRLPKWLLRWVDR